MARFGAVSLVVVMLAMALMPLTSNGVYAAEDDFQVSSDVIKKTEWQVSTATMDTPEWEVDVELMDPSVVDPTPTPGFDDIVVAEIDPEIIDDIVIDPTPAGGYGTIQVNKLGCEDDYNGDYYELAANCAPMGAPFTVYSNAGELQFDGSFTASDLPEGEAWVVESIPDGYGTPIVFCNVYAVTGAESGFFQQVIDQGSLYLWLDAGAWIYCDWFNVPMGFDETGDTGGTVTIVKWYCPAFEQIPVEPDREFYLEHCTQMMDDVDFTLDYPEVEGYEALTKTTGDPVAGTVVFENLDPGVVTVTETIPAGFGAPIVFCGWGAIYDEDGDGIAIAVDGLVPGTSLPDGTLEIELLPNAVFYCDWFNFEHPGDDILIYKYECPEGIDTSSINLDELMVECSQPMSGIDFTLSEDVDGELDILLDVQNTDGSGFAGFYGLKPATYHVTEAIPTGYGTPIVYCGPIDGEFNGYPVTEDGMIGIAFGEYGTIGCYWFNIPTHDDGSITVYKYTCPAGYDPYAHDADPVNDCTYATDGIDFELNGGLAQTTGDYLPGGVTWDGLDAGFYSVREYVPDGYYVPYVICQWYEDLGPFVYDTIEPYATGWVNDTIDLELYEGTHIVCKWFNVPDHWDGGELVVIKYWCDGVVYTEEACELYGSGADFEIEPAGGFGEAYAFTTGWDGTASVWLEAGAYDLYEVDRDWCKAESDQVNAHGNIVITDGETSYVTVYNCGPGKKEPPVKKFPNTGIAPDMGDGDIDGGSGGLLAMLAVVQVGAVIVLRMAKLTPRSAFGSMKR